MIELAYPGEVHREWPASGSSVRSLLDSCRQSREALETHHLYSAKGPQHVMQSQREYRAGIAHIAFVADDFETVKRMYHRLREQGVPISMTMDHGMTKSIYFHDPDGIELEIYCDVSGYDFRSKGLMNFAPLEIEEAPKANSQVTSIRPLQVILKLRRAPRSVHFTRKSKSELGQPSLVAQASIELNGISAHRTLCDRIWERQQWLLSRENSKKNPSTQVKRRGRDSDDQ